MRNWFSRCPAVIASLALTACAGGGVGNPPSTMGGFTPFVRGAAAASVVVIAKHGAAALAGIPVELYTGKHATCPPFNFPCVKKIKGLAKGKTNKNGRVTLKATFSTSELVCAEGSKGGALVQSCRTPFPASVILQFR